jgi:hypothetical protein
MNSISTGAETNSSSKIGNTQISSQSIKHDENDETEKKQTVKEKKLTP